MPLLQRRSFQVNKHKAEYEQLLSQLNAMSIATFVNESYESGVGKSTAITRVQKRGAGDSDVWLFLHHDIDHTAVKKDDDGLHVGTVTINTTLHEQDFMPVEVEEMFADSTPFRLITDIQHTGEMRNRFTVNPSNPDKRIDELVWDGLEFDVVTKDQVTVGGGKLGTLSVTNPEDGMEISIADSPFDIDIVLNELVGYTGDVDFTINQVNMKSLQRPGMKIHQIALETESKINGNTLDSSVLIDMKGILSVLPISNASLDVALNGLGLDGLNLLSELSKSQGADLNSDQMLDEILQVFKEILLPGSLMNYELLLNNRGGDVLLDVSVAIKEEGEDGMTADALEKVVTQRDALDVINLNGLLNADRSALDLTPAMLFLGAVGDYITITDESVTSSITLEGSTLNVNGILLPLDQLIGSLDVPLADLFSQ